MKRAKKKALTKNLTMTSLSCFYGNCKEGSLTLEELFGKCLEWDRFCCAPMGQASVSTKMRENSLYAKKNHNKWGKKVKGKKKLLIKTRNLSKTDGVLQQKIVCTAVWWKLSVVLNLRWNIKIYPRPGSVARLMFGVFQMTLAWHTLQKFVEK